MDEDYYSKLRMRYCEDYDFRVKMKHCIDLALTSTPKGIGKPWAGAVLLNGDGEIIGEGVKSFLPGIKSVVHAERNAIDKASSKINGSKDLTLITTFQPCGKVRGYQLFSPCTELIIERGIKRVVFGLLDESPSFDYRNALGYLTNRGVDVIHLKEMGEKIRKSLMPLFQSS